MSKPFTIQMLDQRGREVIEYSNIIEEVML